MDFEVIVTEFIICAFAFCFFGVLFSRTYNFILVIISTIFTYIFIKLVEKYYLDM